MPGNKTLAEIYAANPVTTISDTALAYLSDGTTDSAMTGANLKRAIPTNTGKTLWVDSVNGNDSAAVSGRMDKPYLTLASAKASAVSGDTIIVRPGTYNEKNLLKDGVYWHFVLGAHVHYTGADNGGIWDDDTTGANGAVECKISGDGVFSYEGTGEINAHAFHITNAGTHVDCNGQEAFMLTVTAGTDGFHRSALHVSAGYLKFLGHAVDAYVGTNATDNFPAAIFWEGGDIDVVVERVKTTGNAYIAWGVAVAANTKLWLRCSHISAGFSLLNMDTSNDTAHLFIQTQTLEIAASSTATGVVANGGLSVIDFDVFDDNATTNNQLVALSGGSVYFTGRRLVTIRNGVTALMGMTGTSNLFLDIDNATATTSQLPFFGNAGSGVLEIWGNYVKQATSGFSSRVLSHSGTGTTRVYGRLDNSLRNASACIVTTSGCIFQSSAVIVANASADSISGTSTIKVYPGAVSNRAANVSITQSVGTLTVDSTVT